MAFVLEPTVQSVGFLLHSVAFVTTRIYPQTALKTRTQQFISFSIALCLGCTSYAQTIRRPSSALQAVVAHVSDFRTTAEQKSECSIGLKFIGDATADATDVLKVRITRAVDDLNRDLVAKETLSPHGLADFVQKKQTGPLRETIYLQNPSRSAKVIKLLEGEVELFCPTPANGGIVVLNDLPNSPSTPVRTTQTTGD